MENAILLRFAEITIYSAAIFLFVLLFRGLLKNRLSPRMRYALWFLVILRLIVPFVWESGFHFITLPAETPAIVAASSPAPIPHQQAAQMPLAGQAGAPGAAAIAPQEALPPDAAANAERTPLTLQQWLLIVWGAGALLVLAGHIAMTRRLCQRIRENGRAPSEGLVQMYAQVRSTLDMRSHPPLVLLDDISSPALTAQLRPRLLLPAAFVVGGAREETALSLMHELMHLKRGDHLVCLLLTLLRVVWWFNPVVWALPPIMRIDMESACDSQVVRKMDRHKKLLYANLLLELGQEE